MAVFISSAQSFLTYIEVDGEYVAVRFRERGVPYNTGMFTTSNEKIAEAIRKSSYFGRSIKEIVEEKKEKKEEKVYDFTYPDVTRTQDANRILSEKHGVDTSELKTKALTLKKAEEINVSFPNL